jgi:hypothetical protein
MLDDGGHAVAPGNGTSCATIGASSSLVVPREPASTARSSCRSKIWPAARPQPVGETTSHRLDHPHNVGDRSPASNCGRRPPTYDGDGRPRQWRIIGSTDKRRPGRIASKQINGRTEQWEKGRTVPCQMFNELDRAPLGPRRPGTWPQRAVNTQRRL